jgi:hypothetical protein
MKIIKHYTTFVFAFLLLATAWQLKVSTTKPRLKLDKQQTALNFDNKFLHVFSMGLKRIIASSVWVSTLLESDLEHVENNKDDSWMYLRFNTISELDPLFLKNYQFGGQYLSIIKDDLKGAADHMEKGLIHYPDDYILNFNLGFLYAIELDKYEIAVSFLEKASESSLAPTNISTLIAKVKFMASGDPEQTYLFLNTLLETTQDQLVIDKLKSDLYSLKAEIDLGCLNNSQEGCSQLDYEGEKYIFKNGVYKARKTYKKYKLYKKSKIKKK